MNKESVDRETERMLYARNAFAGKVGKSSFSTENGCCFLLVLTSGELRIKEGNSYKVERNMFVFLQSNITFSFHSEKRDNHSALLFWVSREITDAFFDYLGDSGNKDKEKLFNNEDPCRFMLSIEEFGKIEREIHCFSEGDSENLDTQLQLHFLVAALFSVLHEKTRYNEMNSAPFWLETVCQKMRKKENFVEGISRMVELSGRTREHLSRSMKKYKALTLSEYINELRLAYAANMLIQSDMHIVDLCYESGFSSLDYFGKQFKLKYGMSPSKFRSTMQKNKE